MRGSAVHDTENGPSVQEAAREDAAYWDDLYDHDSDDASDDEA